MNCPRIASAESSVVNPANFSEKGFAVDLRFRHFFRRPIFFVVRKKPAGIIRKGVAVLRKRLHPNPTANSVRAGDAPHNGRICRTAARAILFGGRRGRFRRRNLPLELAGEAHKPSATALRRAISKNPAAANPAAVWVRRPRRRMENPIRSMNRPSRGMRESATTTL